LAAAFVGQGAVVGQDRLPSSPRIELRLVEPAPSESSLDSWKPSFPLAEYDALGPGVEPLQTEEVVEAAPPGTRLSRADDDALSGVRRAEDSGDEVLLVSFRSAGSKCDPASAASLVRCRLFAAQEGGAAWRSLDWSETLRLLRRPLPTVLYVHGNRIATGEDRSQGLSVYRSLVERSSKTAGPIRFIIWSWPSDQIRGPLKDYKVKAARTQPASWQLAWTIDQLPEEAPLSVFGYSYGARVVTGALHLLAGGSLEGRQLSPRVHPDRDPFKVALLAAALDADWIRPGGFHGRAVTQVSELLLVNNRRDPIMRFYRLSAEGRGVAALGYEGPAGLAGTELGRKIRTVDVTGSVGRHHALVEYLSAGGPVVAPLQYALAPKRRPASSDDAAESSLARDHRGDKPHGSL
jgi:hypothetical protein